MNTPEEVREMANKELINSSTECRSLVTKYLVTPRLHEREWHYGAKGQTYPCWMVLEHSDSQTGIVYTDHGFGPRCPWALVNLTDHSIGDDSASFFTLEDAVRDSFVWEEASIDSHVEASTLGNNGERAFARRRAAAVELGDDGKVTCLECQTTYKPRGDSNFIRCTLCVKCLSIRRSDGKVLCVLCRAELVYEKGRFLTCDNCKSLMPCW